MVHLYDAGSRPGGAVRDTVVLYPRVRLFFRLVGMKDNFQEKLDQLKSGAGIRPGTECPSETEWLPLAAGLLPEAQANELIEHTTNCDVCSLLLRQATEDFAEEVTAGETEQLSSLSTSHPEWQQGFAQKLAKAEPKRSAPAMSWWSFLAWKPRVAPQFAWVYGLATVGLVVASVWLVRNQRRPSLDQLIASAYTEQRPFEPRIAGAAYGPVRQQRSGERSSFGQPAALSQAIYLIKEKLAARPDDTQLLISRGRVELLEGNYEMAIGTFGGLADTHPDSPALLTDLATAYFQRGEARDRASDYGHAVELLSRALAKNPDDPVALFNRAIALEKTYAYDQAIRDWEQYLRLEPSGDWAAEAQRRLNDLREKMKAHEKPAAMLQTDPLVAASLLRFRAANSGLGSWATALDEEYLDLAVREWLPSLYVAVDSQSQATRTRRPAQWDALTVTAEVLRTHHRDPWLADFLSDLPSESASPNTVRQFAAALDVLGRAAKANASGDPDSARLFAETAVRFFTELSSTAGVLRAREEIIYALMRETRTKDCIRAASKQLWEKDLESYAWLKGQALLWNATCQSFAGNLDSAQRLSDQAMELTQSKSYTGQHLRSVLFASGFLRSEERNWDETRNGLRTFWADFNNPFHAYEFYVELANLAEDAERWHLARLVWREATGMIEKTPDRLFAAAAHYNLAVAAMRVRDLAEADSEFRIASQQFAAFPDSPTGRLYGAKSEILLAAVELQQERFDSTQAHLEIARPHLVDISSTWTAFNYYETLGELHLQRGNVLEAEKALWSALQVSEPRLRSLQSDADRLAWERDAGRAYRNLVQMYARQPNNVARALELWEWYRASALRGSGPSAFRKARGYGTLNVGLGSPLLSPVKNTLPTLNHETVISFARLPSGVAAWIFDDRGVSFAWISSSEEDLTHRIKHFAYLCAHPSSDLAHLQQEGRDLYDLLIGPFAQHLQPNRLLIVEPDSVLSEVPWSALVDSHGEYLGTNIVIVVSPGLGYWLNLRSPTTISPEQSALVVAMPTLATAITPRFSPLPDADREAQSVASRFRHSQLLSGTEVTLQRITHGLSGRTVFHFAGHAISGPKQNGLVLASPPSPVGAADEPILLSASDLDRRLLRSLQLVVLSACATAETEEGFSEPDNLVRSFLRTGVPNVVASRWPVDSYITAETMAEFYSHLFDGLPTAYALHRTVNTLRQRPNTSHPYYWAAFGSYGR